MGVLKRDVDEWLMLLHQHKSILHARRAWIRVRRWTEADWYANWDQVGGALEAALRQRAPEARYR
jgi:hypothetical protein